MKTYILALVAGLGMGAQAATAAASAPLELEGYVQLAKVTLDAQGQRQTELVKPDVVVPGDRLILGTRFANAGSEPIENFVISNPVPAAVAVSSAIDPGLLVSVDGGQHWGRLDELTVTDAAGNRRAAIPGDITNVRWTLARIAPGEAGHVEFPVTVR